MSHKKSKHRDTSIQQISNINNRYDKIIKTSTPSTKLKVNLSLNNNESKNDKIVGFVNIHKNLDKNKKYIPEIASRENFNIQLKIEQESIKTLNFMNTNSINQHKLESDIKLT